MSIRNSRSLSERTANVGVTIQKYPIRGEPHDARHLNAVTDITDRARSVPHTLPKTRAELPRIYEFKLFLPPGSAVRISRYRNPFSNDFPRLGAKNFFSGDCNFADLPFEINGINSLRDNSLYRSHIELRQILKSLGLCNFFA